jgi:transposase
MSRRIALSQDDRFQRVSRVFSEEFKRRKVVELEGKLCTISDISHEYGVSRTSIYNWILKYSVMAKKKERVIVESSSDTLKIKKLQDRVAELERMVGQKQIMLEFRDKMIEIAEQTYKVDIKKKFGTPPSTGTASTKDKKTGA